MIDDLGLVPTFRAKHNSNFRPGLSQALPEMEYDFHPYGVLQSMV